MIQDLDQQQYVDIFGKGTDLGEDKLSRPLNFGGNDNNDVDILSVAPTSPVTEDIPDEKEKEVEGDQNINKDVDILGDEKEKVLTYDFKDTSGYFSDRFKSGKFVAITEDQADGTKTAFIPKTPEEFDEVIDIQVNYKLDEKLKNLEANWYSSKSPAWQAVSKYAEMTDDPADILPFIQGIQTIEGVSSLDPEDIEHAERIVRIRLQQKGDDQETIDETVQSLKTTDKLTSTANKYKPTMVNEERNRLASMVQQKQEEEKQYLRLVNNIRENAVKAIDSPIFGKQKLKQEEKAAIYDLIAEPSRETKGYQIYTVIDQLFEQGDFDTLRQVALLLTKKDSFMTYINTAAADKAGETLQRKLRISTEGKTSGKDTYEEGTTTISRKQYNPTPRFGR